MRKTIGVCIPTYKREKQLENLLISLGDQTHNNNFKFEVIVIDNDKNKSAKSVIDKVQLNLLIHYHIEPRKGVANVRNKCIEIAKKIKYDYIAFIDDDELPSNTWLDNLYKASIEYKAGVVFGPVIATYDNKIPNWIIEGEFFDRPRYKTGHKISYSGAGNVLINLEILQNLDITFDTSFDKSGGEDTDFFMRLNKEEINMIWCDEAVVSEPVDINRANPKWLYLRSYCGGSNFALCEIKNNNSFIKQLKRIIKGIVHCILGLYKLIISANNIIKVVRAKMRINMGLGQIVGTLGINNGKQY